MKFIFIAASVLVGAARGQTNRKCGAEFEMEVAIMIDMNTTETDFMNQKYLTNEVLKFLPDVGNKARVVKITFLKIEKNETF